MSEPRVPGTERVAVAVAAAVLACAAAALLAGPVLDPAAAWGVNAARFLPPRTRLVLAAIALLVPGLVLAAHRTRARVSVAAATGLFVAGFAALAWRFRVAHVLLGDGIPITSTLPDTSALHPREPLSSWVLHEAWRMLGPVFAAPGRARADVVQDVVATVSVAAGIVYALAVAGLARELPRHFPGEHPERSGADVALATLVLAAPGATLVFFGYVEHYAWPAACAALFLWTVLRAQGGRGPWYFPLGVLLVACAFHFSSVVLAPFAAVLVAASLAAPRSRGPALRDTALVLAAASAAIAGWRIAADYDALHHFLELARSNRSDAAYLVSAAHVRDFTNEHALLGPLGLILVLPLAPLLPGDGRSSRALRAALVVGASALAAATWLTPDMPLGYARDWDVFAAAGVALAGLALATLFALVRGERARRVLLAGACAVTLLQALPWIALNHSSAASVARFATLPLGLGRTESTLAWWHMQRKEYGTARVWIERSLRANPGNIRAVDLYGRIALLEGNPLLAVKAYRTGIVLRPERPEYRLQLAFALHTAGRVPEALAALDTLERTHPDEPALWVQRAMGQHALGDDAAARASLARALVLNPAMAGTARAVRPSLMVGR